MTKDITASLKAELGQIDSYEKRVAHLYNKYKGEDCYILSCGPSLNNYSEEYLNKVLKDKLVLCVKTAYNRHRSVTDFHFFNCCNLPFGTIAKPYHYDYDDHTIAISSSNFPEYARWSVRQEYDIFCQIPLVNDASNPSAVSTNSLHNPKINLEQSQFVTVNKNFEKYLLSNQFERPVGPGIMYETVFFFAMHLGVKSINVIGWDLGTKAITDREQYNHFYSHSTQFFNPGYIMDWEVETTAKASKELYYWMKEKNVDLNVISDCSSVYEGIPRIKL